MNVKDLFASIRNVLVIDWPTREIPEALAHAGFEVFVKGGPKPDDYSIYEWNGEQVLSHRIGRPPEHAELVYSYRPLSELPEIISLARRLGAKAIWTQSGRLQSGAADPKGCWLSEEEKTSASKLVRDAGMTYISEPFIVDAVREFLAGQKS